jgi:hypothetical protein
MGAGSGGTCAISSPIEFSSSSMRWPISSTASTRDDVGFNARARASGLCARGDGAKSKARALLPMMASDIVANRLCICCSRFCTCGGEGPT